MAKYLIFFIFILSLVFIQVPPTFAATVSGQIPNGLNYKAPQQADFIGLNLAHAGTCWIVGTDPTNPSSLCDAMTPSGVQLYAQVPGGGALGVAKSAVFAMYESPPVSTDLYLARTFSSLDVSPAYAQGTPPTVPGSGSQVLIIVLNLWEVARNITYLLFILMFVVVGLMVMFRRRINPQTIVTIQMALPRLILGLILVTFSYLIASLLVDLAFLGAGFLGIFFTSAFANGGIFGDITGVNAVARGGNVPGIFTLFFFGTSVVKNTIWGFAQLFAGFFPRGTATLGSSNTLWQSIVSFVLAPINTVTGFIGAGVGIIIVLVILIAALIQCLRLVWGLLQCYISILVFTVLGPFIILASSLPGQEKLLGFWWRNILGNVLAFPAVFGAFLFAAAILQTVTTSSNTGAAAALPLFGGIDTSLLSAMLALGIVLGTPAIPRMTRQLVGAQGLGAIAGAAGQGIGNAATLAAVFGGPQVLPAARVIGARFPGVAARFGEPSEGRAVGGEIRGTGHVVGS